MPQTVTAETLEGLWKIWTDPASRMHWPCPFVLPPWLETWWGAFAGEAEMFLRAVRSGEDLIGVAPLVIQGETARFMGSPDVCDYQDFILAPGRGREFAAALFSDLAERGVTHLELGAVRPDSAAWTEVLPVARERGLPVVDEIEDVAMELDLPGTWDGFLLSLDAKQRHEIRRKLRRLREAGRTAFVRVGDADGIDREVDRFLNLFGAYRSDKASFLSERMASFFRALMRATARAKLLSLGFLEIDGERVAGVLCFDYRETTYLYNNGYDPRFQELSVGILSKVLSIRDSISRGRARYDLLKGAETYKHRLGAREVPLHRCRLRLG